jgi:hypothetical protein
MMKPKTLQGQAAVKVVVIAMEKERVQDGDGVKDSRGQSQSQSQSQNQGQNQKIVEVGPIGIMNQKIEEERIDVVMIASAMVLVAAVLLVGVQDDRAKLWP